MTLAKSETARIIETYGKNPNNSGATEVQVALLTERLQKLSEHFKTNTKDHHSRVGLLRLVGKRRRLLNYLHKTNPETYKTLIGQLGIRK